MKQGGITTKKDNVNEYDNEDNGNVTTITKTATKTMTIKKQLQAKQEQLKYVHQKLCAPSAEATVESGTNHKSCQVSQARREGGVGVGDACFFLTMRCFNDAMFSNS